MTTVKKENVVCDVDDADLEHYLSRGFEIINGKPLKASKKARDSSGED